MPRGAAAIAAICAAPRGDVLRCRRITHLCAVQYNCTVLAYQLSKDLDTGPFVIPMGTKSHFGPAQLLPRCESRYSLGSVRR